jgi:hypothetical protein
MSLTQHSLALKNATFLANTAVSRSVAVVGLWLGTRKCGRNAAKNAGALRIMLGNVISRFVSAVVTTSPTSPMMDRWDGLSWGV